MRSLAVLVLLATTFAGCVGFGTDADGSGAFSAGDFQVEIVFDDRNVYYAGDPVQLLARAAGNVTFAWDMGDGTLLDGADVAHVYALFGSYDVRVMAERDDGANAYAGLTIEVQDLYGGVGQPTPAPSGDDSGIINVTVIGDEPSAGGVVRLGLTGPAALSEPGQWTVWVGDVAHTLNFTALPQAMEITMPAAGRASLLWHATVGASDYMGNVVFDVWGEPIEFGEPTGQQWLRPGLQTIAGGAQCTTNFLFHYKWYRFFVGSAAHCVDPTDLNAVCQAGSGAKIGSTQSIRDHGGKSVNTKLAYSSWITMDEKGGGSCPSNDFALYELAADGRAAMHPKVLFFGGPTAMAPAGGYGTGQVLHGYGASQLHGNVGVAYPGQDEVNSKRGVSLGASGYYQQMYFAIPGIPGDSGGPAFGPNGEALGAASVIYYAPFTGSNSYTIIPRALAYMEDKEGWAPELITFDSWSATGT